MSYYLLKSDSNFKILYDNYIVNATVKNLILIHRSSVVAVGIAVLNADVDYLTCTAIIFLTFIYVCLKLVNKYSKVLAVSLLFNN